MKKLFLFLTLVLFLGIGTGFSQSAAKKHEGVEKTKTASHKVVIQISSADTMGHKGLMNNIKHIKEEWGNDVLIEVVVHGPGADLVTKEKATQADAIQELIKKGVQFVLCRNTMKQRNILEDQVLPNVGFVPSGVREIILKQEAGWSYLKAGL